MGSANGGSDPAGDFLESVLIRDFGCIRRLVLGDLKPLNALIGPNDSGKSLILRALRTACQFGASNFELTERGLRLPFDPEVQSLWPTGTIRLAYAGSRSYQVSSKPAKGSPEVVEAVRVGTQKHTSGRGGWNVLGLLASPKLGSEREFFAAAVHPAPLVRLNVDALKRPSALIPSDDSVALLDDRGIGLAAIYDALINRNLDGFLSIRDEAKRLFPSLQGIGFRNVSDRAKQLQFDLDGGHRVPAHLMSEGLLCYLAFAALPHLAPTRLLLVEEPENGLHPARIVDVLRVLREVSKQTQVILTTHSPIVVNELEPEEVRVVTRNAEEGTRATLMKDTPNFQSRSEVYDLGELWLSYADGTSEEALLSGGPRP